MNFKNNTRNIVSVLCLLILNVSIAFAQTSTEAFEDETGNSTSFTDNGLLFNVTSSEGYNVFENGFTSTGTPHSVDTCSNCGWSGSAVDQKFIDNSGLDSNGMQNDNGENNGSSFTITTDNSSNLFVSDLYLFASTNAIENHNGTVTFTGRRNNMQVFTFSKISGFANVETFTPNNGFTFIDFTTAEGAGNFSLIPIDELVFTSTGDLDYMALDAFRWQGTLLPVELLNFSVE